MQIVHKINDFLYTLFPELENATEEEIINAIQKYYTYGPFVPKITINNDLVTIDVDTETILTQDADYNRTVALLEKTVKLTTHFQCKLTTSFGAN